LVENFRRLWLHLPIHRHFLHRLIRIFLDFLPLLKE
jgi:hypothetical protein